MKKSILLFNSKLLLISLLLNLSINSPSISQIDTKVDWYNNNPKSLYNQSLILYKNAKYELAIPYFEQVLKFYPNDDKIRFRYSFSLYALRYYTLAEIQLNKTISTTNSAAMKKDCSDLLIEIKNKKKIYPQNNNPIKNMSQVRQSIIDIAEDSARKERINNNKLYPYRINYIVSFLRNYQSFGAKNISNKIFEVSNPTIFYKYPSLLYHGKYSHRFPNYLPSYIYSVYYACYPPPNLDEIALPKCQFKAMIKNNRGIFERTYGSITYIDREDSLKLVFYDDISNISTNLIFRSLN